MAVSLGHERIFLKKKPRFVRALYFLTNVNGSAGPSLKAKMASKAIHGHRYAYDSFQLWSRRHPRTANGPSWLSPPAVSYVSMQTPNLLRQRSRTLLQKYQKPDVQTRPALNASPPYNAYHVEAAARTNEVAYPAYPAPLFYGKSKEGEISSRAMYPAPLNGKIKENTKTSDPGSVLRRPAAVKRAATAPDQPPQKLPVSEAYTLVDDGALMPIPDVLVKNLTPVQEQRPDIVAATERVESEGLDQSHAPWRVLELATFELIGLAESLRAKDGGREPPTLYDQGFETYASQPTKRAKRLNERAPLPAPRDSQSTSDRLAKEVTVQHLLATLSPPRPPPPSAASVSVHTSPISALDTGCPELESPTLPTFPSSSPASSRGPATPTDAFAGTFSAFGPLPTAPLRPRPLDTRYDNVLADTPTPTRPALPRKSPLRNSFYSAHRLSTDRVPSLSLDADSDPAFAEALTSPRPKTPPMSPLRPEFLSRRTHPEYFDSLYIKAARENIKYMRADIQSTRTHGATAAHHQQHRDGTAGLLPSSPKPSPSLRKVSTPTGSAHTSPALGPRKLSRKFSLKKVWDKESGGGGGSSSLLSARSSQDTPTRTSREEQRRAQRREDARACLMRRA